MNDGIHFGEFPDYIEEENRRWKQFFGRHPEALDLPLDIAGTWFAGAAYLCGGTLW
jgi:hypothetical protein